MEPGCTYAARAYWPEPLANFPGRVLKKNWLDISCEQEAFALGLSVAGKGYLDVDPLDEMSQSAKKARVSALIKTMIGGQHSLLLPRAIVLTPSYSQSSE
jgi:hypothetical protein